MRVSSNPRPNSSQQRQLANKVVGNVSNNGSPSCSPTTTPRSSVGKKLNTKPVCNTPSCYMCAKQLVPWRIIGGNYDCIVAGSKNNTKKESHQVGVDRLDNIKQALTKVLCEACFRISFPLKVSSSDKDMDNNKRVSIPANKAVSNVIEVGVAVFPYCKIAPSKPRIALDSDDIKRRDSIHKRKKQDVAKTLKKLHDRASSGEKFRTMTNFSPIADRLKSFDSNKSLASATPVSLSSPSTPTSPAGGEQEKPMYSVEKRQQVEEMLKKNRSPQPKATETNTKNNSPRPMQLTHLSSKGKPSPDSPVAALIVAAKDVGSPTSNNAKKISIPKSHTHTNTVTVNGPVLTKLSSASSPPPPPVEEPRGWFSGWLFGSGNKTKKEEKQKREAHNSKMQEELEAKLRSR